MPNFPGNGGPGGGGPGGGGPGGGGPGGGGFRGGPRVDPGVQPGPPDGPAPPVAGPIAPPVAGPAVHPAVDPAVPAGPSIIDKTKLKQHTDELIEAISSPAFVAAMYAMKATPQNQRLAFATANLTPSVLANQGVKFPVGMRVTSRYFEPGMPDTIEVTDAGAKISNGLPVGGPPGVGAWGCACGGAASVCGGAGGGANPAP